MTRFLFRFLCLLVSSVASLGLAFSGSPVLSTFSLESSLLLAVCVGPFLAAATAELAAHRPQLGLRAPKPLRAALWNTLLLAVLPPVVALGAKALVSTPCQPLLSLAFFVLGPVFGWLLCSMMGAVIGSLLRQPLAASALAFVAVLALMAWGLLRFWDSPALMVYSPVAGYFPGAFYDRGNVIHGAYWTYRLGTLAWLIALGGLVHLLQPKQRHRDLEHAPTALIDTKPPKRLPAWFALIAAFLGIWVYAEGERLGHRTSSDQLHEALGASLSEGACVLHYPEELAYGEAQRLAKDCAFRIVHMSQRLGVSDARPIHAFLYRSADEKKRLIGAGHTYVAKPWRREVHLQVERWPHPVFAHEIAHVVAGTIAPGPFRVAAHAMGWWPDPGIIEGTAVALAWSVYEGLTPHQWAAVLMNMERLPSIHEITGPTFLTQPSKLSYTAAGSFLAYVQSKYGKQVLRRIYAHPDIEEATGTSLNELEVAWRDMLRSVAVPEDAWALAQQRFEDRGLFFETCPHRTARLEDALVRATAGGSPQASRRACEDLLAMNPLHGQALITRVALHARRGQFAEAERILRVSRAKGLSATVHASAEHAMADGHWRAGHIERAASMYERLLQQPASEDAKRLLEVKALATHGNHAERQLLFHFLLGPYAQPPTPRHGMYVLRQLREIRKDGLADYLEALQLMHESRFDAGNDLFRRAKERGLPTERIEREALRQHAIAMYASKRSKEASEAFWKLSKQASKDEGMRAWAADWLARLRIDAKRL